MEYFNYLVRIITNDTRDTREITARIVMEKAAFNRNNTVFSPVNFIIIEGRN